MRRPKTEIDLGKARSEWIGKLELAISIQETLARHYRDAFINARGLSASAKTEALIGAESIQRLMDEHAGSIAIIASRAPEYGMAHAANQMVDDCVDYIALMVLEVVKIASEASNAPVK